MTFNIFFMNSCYRTGYCEYSHEAGVVENSGLRDMMIISGNLFFSCIQELLRF